MQHRRDDPPGWIRREAARTPARPRDRVLALFRAPQNIAALADALRHKLGRGPLYAYAVETLEDAVYEFSRTSEGRAMDVLQSDPVALRGAQRPALDTWAELRRLNGVFLEDRLSVVRDAAPLLVQGPDEYFGPSAAHPGRRHVPRDAVADEDEPYHVRMFEADSLRPPGLEHMNTPGPAWALREDQSTWTSRAVQATQQRAARATQQRAARAARQRREGYVTGPSGRALLGVNPGIMDEGPGAQLANPAGNQLGNPAGGARLGADINAAAGSGARAVPRGRVPAEAIGEPAVDLAGEDEAWSLGNPNRTPEQAMAEYWGDGHAASDTALGAPEQMGEAYGARYGWGAEWEENGGTRFMRYKEIPFWQKGGREGYDRDIEETLGTGMREGDGQVRGWDMDRLRDPAGQEYRRYGPRSGHVV